MRLLPWKSTLRSGLPYPWHRPALGAVQDTKDANQIPVELVDGKVWCATDHELARIRHATRAAYERRGYQLVYLRDNPVVHSER